MNNQKKNKIQKLEKKICKRKQMNNQKKIWRKHSQEVDQQVEKTLEWLKKNKPIYQELELSRDYERSRQHQKQREKQKTDNMYNMHKPKPLKPLNKFPDYTVEDMLEDVKNNGKNTLFPKNFYF